MKNRILHYTTILLLLIAGFALLSAPAHAQTSTPSSMVKDDLFAGTEKFSKGASDVTEVTMDPQSLGMVDGKEASRAHRMVLNVVRTYSYDKPGMYNIADVEEFRNKLNTGDWHCSVHTRDSKSNSSTDICSRHRTDDLTETAIITVEPKQLTFIHTITHGHTSWPGSAVMLGPMPGTYSAAAFRAEGLIARAEMQADLAAARATMTADMAQMRIDLGSVRPRVILHIDKFNAPNPNAPLSPLLGAPAPPAGAPAPETTVPAPLSPR